MAKHAWLRRAVPALAAALLLAAGMPSRAEAFAPLHHLEMILERLEEAGYSEGQAWLLAYFSIEIDMATESPDVFCWWPIRWPTRKYVCQPAAGKGDYDPCARKGTSFADWADWCVPFHNCRLTYPAESRDGSVNVFENRLIQGLQAFTKEWSSRTIEDYLHITPGERCYDVLVEFGHALHAAQDFYSHSNWVEVFHNRLGFGLDEIPTWTSFMEAQRGQKLNLLLKQKAGGDVEKAMALYDRLGYLQEGGDGWHDANMKDSDELAIYSDADIANHKDSDGHTILDYHEAAAQVASDQVYQLGLQLKSNVVNNPDLGPAAWSCLFNCVSEMAAFDGVSYEDELATYKKGIGRLKFYSNNMRTLCALIAPAAIPVIQPLVPFPIGFEAISFCKLAPAQKWH